MPLLPTLEHGADNSRLGETREWNKELPGPTHVANIIRQEPGGQPTVVFVTQTEEIPVQAERIEAAHRLREFQERQKEG